MLRIRVLFAVMTAFAVTACTDVVQKVILPSNPPGGSNPPATPPPPPPGTVRFAVSPKTVSIFKGDTLQLTLNKSGTCSTANTTTASVTSTNRVVGVGVGLARIVCTAGNELDTALVTVNKRPEVQSISMTLTTYTGSRGDQLYPSVTVAADAGASTVFRCGSNNPAVATGDTTRVGGVLKGWFKLISTSPLNGASPVQVWCETVMTHTFPDGTQDRLRTSAQIFVKP